MDAQAYTDAVHEAWHYVFVSLCGMCFLHVAVDFVASRLPSYRHKSGEFAFNVVAGLAVAVLSGIGLKGWLIDGFPADRIYETSWRTTFMSGFMFAYQIYDLLTALVYPSLFSVAMIVHHVVTGSLAVSGIYQFMHGHADFFFGSIEASNIVLTIMDFFKLFPFLIKRYPNFYVTIRMIFAFCFVTLRLVVWPVKCYQFYGDIYEAYASGRVALAERLGAMEVTWGIILIKGVIKQFKPKTA